MERKEKKQRKQASLGSYRSANKALVACLGLSNVCLALQADIRADSSRDGKVDIFSNADLKHKLKWSNEEGAIFLANIGDTDRRCSKLALAGPPLSNEALAACNDASDDIQRSPKYLAPLQTVPLKDLSPEAWGTVAVHQEIARKNVRIFQQKNEDWVIVDNDHKLSQRELQDGLILGIDARDTRRPLGWDGRVEVHFHVQDGIHSSDDYVRLRVAPVLSYHHLQPAEEFITTAGNETDSPDQLHFVNNMTKAIRETGVDKPLFLFSHSDDVWSQDHLEPSYSSMPGPDGLITIQVMIRSSQPGRVAGRQVFEYLRKTDRGAIYSTGGTRDEVDSMGNLETIPPYTHRGKSYPAGRIIEGSHGKLNPQVYNYMSAQEVQDPLLLDADWLGVGHVDEFIQFMPSEKGLHGWVLFIADPISGLNILRQAEEDGHGETRAFSRSNATTLHPSPPDPYVPGYTISQLLSNKELVEDNDKFVKLIDAVRNFLQDKTGITDKDIYPVPTIFETGVCWGPDDGVNPERNCSKNHAAALYPGVINGVVMSDTQYLSPDPWGPIIGGVDIMKKATNEVYGKIGYHVTYIDDWYSHHRDGGEVHCGSNSIRTATKPWWVKDGVTGKKGGGWAHMEKDEF